MNMKPKEISIKIHSLGFGDYHTFTVDPYITVEELKKVVCQKNDFPLTTIRLLFKGKSLISSSSIYDYGITDNDMLYAVPASRIPPQYLPISFNITIQSNQPVVYHYRPDTRDFDRQINTMRTKIAEIQEACSSALLRISLTQNLLTRRDNPKSIKIPKAIIPSPGPIRASAESEASNSTTPIQCVPSINTTDLSLLSDEEKMKRYEHGCRIVQGKLLEALKAITTNVTSLKQYKVMENHGEMGAVFTREGPLPEPPTLTRDLLISNVTSGLGELFGAPGSNLVPHTIFHFPEEQTDTNLQRNRSDRNERINRNREINNEETNSNAQKSNEEFQPPPASQLFPSHMTPPIPSEITNSVVQQAHSQISLKPENQIQTNQNNQHRFHNIFDHHRHHRRHHNRRPFHPFFDLSDVNFFNSDSDNSSSSSKDSDYDEQSNRNINMTNNRKKKKRNSNPSPIDDFLNDHTDSNDIRSYIRINPRHINIMDRLRQQLDDNDDPNIMERLEISRAFERRSSDDEFENKTDDNSNEETNNINDDDDFDDNNDNDNDNESQDNNSLPRFFTPEEVNQLNNDKESIEEAYKNDAIPNLNPEYYQTRVLDGY